jgi:hypothetical protein
VSALVEEEADRLVAPPQHKPGALLVLIHIKQSPVDHSLLQN